VGQTAGTARRGSAAGGPRRLWGWLSIRTRLAAWFVLIVAALLATFSLTVYQLTRHSLLGEIERDVRQRAAAVAAADRAGALRPAELDAFTAPDVFVQKLNTGGAVVAGSANLGGRRLPFSPTAVRADQVQEVRVGGLPLFLYGRPLQDGGRVRGYVLVARSPQAIYLALGRLRRVLYPGAALALAGAAGWLLVRRAMRPLARLDRTAAAIAATGDHTRRLAFTGPPDEIGRLAATIDGMLGSLEDAHHQLQDLNATQRRFLADVSHELRTPLTIMLSSLNLLARVGAADAEFRRATLGDMRVEVDRMARMVRQLLIMARSDADAAVAWQPVLVADVVADAVRQQAADGGAVTLTCRDLDRLDQAVVQGDPDYLKQLFLILLGNAVKYTPAGGSVEVSGTLDAGTVLVTVADTGIGIAAADLPRVFDRFYRAENARFQEGMGLGLAIARHIAEQHGGRLEVASELGRGSRFTVTLPLRA
jgi:two-component system OmpR family sensor kinase